MKKSMKYSVVICLLLPVLLFAQARYLDELPKELQTEKITDVIDLLKFSDYYLTRDLNKSLLFIDKAKEYKVKEDSQSYIDIAEANYYYELGDYSLSANKATEGFNKLENTKDKKALRSIRNLILKADKDKSSIENFETRLIKSKALIAETKQTFPSLELASYNLNAANLSMYLKGDLFLSAEQYLQTALENFKLLKSETGKGMVFIKYARYYKILFLKQKNKAHFNKALEYINKAKSVFGKLNQKNNLAYANYTLATLNSILGDHESSIVSYKKSLKQYKFLKNFVKVMKINEHLFIAYSILNKQDLAIQVNLRALHLKDSLFVLEKKKLITDAEVKFNLEKIKSENKIKELQSRKNQNLYLGSLIILGLVVLSMIFNMSKLKSKKKAELIAIELKEIQKRLTIEQELRASELKALKSQMNPHFIFNALNSIQDYIISNEKKLAREYLVKFSRLIRMYLEQTQQSEVVLSDEVKALELYLYLEKDRFDNDFKYEIEIDDALDQNNIYVPALFIQPYVENALKHGLMHKKENKKLEVIFSKLNVDTMQCVIIDNGIGREASAIINKKRRHLHKSFATSANEKRVTLINKMKSDDKISVEIEDLYDDRNQALGTKVSLKIPV